MSLFFKSPSSPIYVRMVIYFGVRSFIRVWASYRWHLTPPSPSRYPLLAPAQLGVRFAPTSPLHAGIFFCLEFPQVPIMLFQLLWVRMFRCLDVCGVSQTDPLYHVSPLALTFCLIPQPRRQVCDLNVQCWARRPCCWRYHISES